MRSSWFSTVFLSLLALLLFSCAEQEKPEPPPPKPNPPAEYKVKFETTKGDFVIQVHRDWAPHGADHFFDLVWSKFYDGVRFHRVIRRYIVQWGINGDPKLQAIYGQMRIRDDPPNQSNRRGTISFAKLGPNSRTTQVFINLRDNQELDQEAFVPFGEVVKGMDTVERLWSSYGEVAPRGTGPDPRKAMIEGNAYFDREFPRLDSITRTMLIFEKPASPPAGEGESPKQ